TSGLQFGFRLETRRERFLLATKLHRQGLENLAASLVVGVTQQPVGAVAIVIPPWMIGNRIKAHALQIHALIHGRGYFAAHIAKPARTVVALAARFRNKHGPAITFPKLAQDLAKRPVQRIAKPQRAPVVNPLIVVVVIEPNDVDVLRRAAQLRRLTPAKHVQALKLETPVALRRLAILRARRI